MPVAQVTADYVNQPKEGKRFGSIKTKELGYVSVKPSDLGQFTKGATYQIEYTETDEGYKNLVRIVAPANGATKPNGTQNMDNAKSIFITGVVGRAMQGGQFQVSDIAALTHAAASAFDKEMAGK